MLTLLHGTGVVAMAVRLMIVLVVLCVLLCAVGRTVGLCAAFVAPLWNVRVRPRGYQSVELVCMLVVQVL